ncbi:MAG: ATP-dependent DNA helicase RecQ [Verrucomicrobiales bacterium]|jgi:ATP-dependent DNA helicase RecQ
MNSAEMPTTKKTQEVLKEIFGFSAFRPHQEELVMGVLAGSDVFGIMPTGGGKSLCYQLPAVLSEGCAIVVSPLIALMKDQVDAALSNGIRAACANSSVSRDARMAAARAYESGALDLLYVAPERLAVEGVLERLRNCPTGAPAFFAIDEAHCLSEWGHDFRPDYLFLSKLREAFPKVPIAAFTATATQKVAADIAARLHLHDPVRVRASFDRQNLFYEVRAKRDWETQLVEFVRARPDQSGIIYRTTRKSVEATAALLNSNGIAARGYHAGLGSDERATTQEAFIRDDASIIVATIAFGMGIDKSDVRFVVHGDIPKNIESYYQETGRAGRDGESSHCLLLYAPGDAVKIRRFSDEIADEAERQRTLDLLREMERFASVPACRRRSLLHYFEEEFAQDNCGGCDYCAGEFKQVDATRDAQIVLSAIARSGERFGAVHVCDIITGAATAKIRQFGHESLKTYGIGRNQPKTHWRSVLDALIAAGIVGVSNDTYGVPKLTEEAWQVMRGQRAFARHEDTRTEPEKERGRRNRRPVDDNLPYHHGMFEDLRQKRKAIADASGLPPYVVFSDRTLRQMAAYMPQDVAQFSQLHGIGAHKLETYGKSFLTAISDFLKLHPDAESERVALATLPAAAAPAIKRQRGETYQLTLAMLQKGKSIEEISAGRGITAGTVEGHIAQLLEDGEDFDWRKFVPQETEALLRKLFKEHGVSTPLTPIVTAADGAASYGQARILRTAMATE